MQAGMAQILESTMLVCFGAAWPFSIVKMLRTRQSAGKSTVFLVLVFSGYVAGASAKWLRAAAAGCSPEPVTALYVVNAALVAIDLVLFIRFRGSSPNPVAGPASITGTLS